MAAGFTGSRILLAFILGSAFGGEEPKKERIEERLAWFAQARGLKEVLRPDLKRRAALQKLVTREKAKRALQPSWVSLGPNTATMLNWQMGRVAGRISALAVNPDNTDVLYLAAGSGGVWKTVDGGGSWTPIFDRVGTQTIGSLLLEAGDPDKLWVGTGDHTQGCFGYFGMGLFLSTDGGASFEPRNGSSGHFLELSHVAAIARGPSGVMFAGGHGFCVDGVGQQGGLFRSEDDGLTWNKVLAGAISDIVPHPNNTDLVYAAVGRFGAAENGVYRSVDGGSNWNRMENGIDAGSLVSRTRLTQAPSDPNTLYSLMNHTNGEASLFRSIDGGDSWQLRRSAICDSQCWYNLSFAVHPTLPATLLIGSVRFGVSEDGGFSHSFLIEEWGQFQRVHQDVHVLVYDPNNPNRFWIGTDGGLWRTDNSGVFYTNLNANLNITQLYDVAVRHDESARVFGGAMDNSSMRTEGDVLWNVTFVHGDGVNNAIDPLDGDIVYQMGVPQNGPNLVRSTTGGGPGHFTPLAMTGTVAGESWGFQTPITIATDAAQTSSSLFIGSFRVYRSDDRGDTWLPLSPGGLTGGSISIISAAPNPSGITLYTGSYTGQIHRSDDAHSASPTWQMVTGNYPGNTVTDIAIDSANPMRVFVTRGGFGESRLYGSTTGGTSWTGLGVGLPEVPANSVAFDPHDNNRLLVGTDLGVYDSRDGGQSFEPMNNALPLGCVITDLEVSDDPHVLTAATYGRGAWRVSLETFELSVEVGPNQSTCETGAVNLAAAASNGAAPLTWTWSVVSGPDTSSMQFNNPTRFDPQFTPSTAGTYILRVVLEDGEADIAEDEMTVTAEATQPYFGQMLARWRAQNGGAAFLSELDRNADLVIEVRDMVIQVNEPRCINPER